jgi:peptide/nickel transport system substrate-binding protein
VRARRWIVALALPLVLAACTTPGASSGASASGGAATSGGTLVMALSAEPDVLDPTLANTFPARVVFTSFCEKLYDTNEHLELVPQLAAETPRVSADGLTVTIPLRQGVKFNDGTPFNAEAVKTSLDRHRTLKGSARTKELASVQDVTVVDPNTVRLTLKYPFTPLGAQLADRAGLIMSPTALQQLGDNFGTAPVCVGPFTFQSRTSGSEIVFTKSTDYYDADKVKLDGVTYRIITDPNVRRANLESGDVQAAERITATDATALKNSPDVTIQDVDTIAYQAVSINLGNTTGTATPTGQASTPLGQSAMLREAFELSLDRNAINKVVFADANAVDCLPLPLQSQFRPSDPQCTPYDPERARQLVAQSGVPTPIPVDLMVPAGNEAPRTAEVIAGMAKDVGFDVRINQQEFVSSLSAARAGQFDVFLIGWSGRIDPDGNLNDLVTTGGSNNFSGLSDPQVDDLVKRAAAATDQAERADLYGQAIRRVKELRSVIYLYHDAWFLGTSKNLQGVVYYPDGIPRFTTASFTD